MEINIASYQTFRSGSSYIPLPRIIERRKATVNIKSDTEFCFVFALLCHKYGKDLRGRALSDPNTYLKYFRELNLNNIEMPITKSGIKQFERQNPSFSFTIFTLESDNTISSPVYKSQTIKQEHVRLLQLTDKEFTKSHFVLIRNLARLLRRQAKNRSTIFCENCLDFFSSIQNLVRHIEIGCNGLRAKFPKEDFLSFKRFDAYQRHKFVIYADLEMLLVPVDTASPNTVATFSQTLNRLEPFIAAYKIKSPIKDTFFEGMKIFAGKDCMREFILSLEASATYIYDNYLSKNYPISLTEEDLIYISLQTKCYSCQKELSECGGGVRDHDHHIKENNFRQVLCNLCNLSYFRRSNLILIYIHNLNFDSHPILIELARQNRKITAICINHETSISFSTYFFMRDKTKVELRFMCSYRHLSESLATLAKDVSDFPAFEKLQSEYGMEKTDIAKQVFCYDYMTSFDVLKETELPPIEKFFNRLTGKGITDEQYESTKNFFNCLKTKTLLEFAIAYCAFDVAVLCDVFEDYRNNSIALLRLDPVYFYTCASLSFANYLSSVEGSKINLLTCRNTYDLLVIMHSWIIY